MPIEYFDPTNYCGCDGCQSVLSDEQREEYRLAEAVRLATIAQRDAEQEEIRRQRRAARAAREEEERLRAAQPFVCPECDQENTLGNSLMVRGEAVCTNCALSCTGCARPILRDGAHEVTRMWGSDMHLCDDCVTECYRCGDTHALVETYLINDERYCSDCSHNCEHCDERYVDECESEDCSNRVRGLSAYGKTYANRWLGGPVSKAGTMYDRGYYLGFELEISANSGDVQPIYDWAQQNLGYSDAVDCKEDSSVDGFEIASQPMTPEFFESVKWESLFDLLNSEYPLRNRPSPRGVDPTEPVDHGLHVHIGRAAFGKDDIATAAFCYLIGQGNHLVRIGRREPTTYCKKVDKPVSSAIKSANYSSGRHQKQASKPSVRNLYLGRDAINLSNNATIEIRAFRSTRKADDLRDAVRLVYVAAEYIRSLRMGNGSVSPRSLHWATFAAWVGVNHPEAFASIAGITDKKVVR